MSQLCQKSPCICIVSDEFVVLHVYRVHRTDGFRRRRKLVKQWNDSLFVRNCDVKSL